MGDEPPEKTSILGQGDTVLREVDLDDVVVHRPLDRGRLLRIGAVALVVVVVFGAVLRSITAGGLGAPSAVATSAPPVASALITANVSYGTLRVNGHTVKGPPPALISLQLGTNTISLDAPPFQRHTCTLVAPINEDITVRGCDLSTSAGVFDLDGKPIQPDYTINFSLGQADLSPELFAAAQTKITQILDGLVFQTTVPAGQYFSVGTDPRGDIESKIALSPLPAVLQVALPSAVPEQPLEGCRPTGFCDGAAELSNHVSGDTPPFWLVAISALGQWQFTDSSGHTATSGWYAASMSMPIPIAYEAKTQSWQILQSISIRGDVYGANVLPEELRDGFCTGGYDALSRMLGDQPGGVGEVQDQGFNGCELQVIGADGSHAGYFIWRFGVLLAADKQAHQLLQNVPMAPQTELQALVGAA